MSSTNVIDRPSASTSEKARDEFVEILGILAHKLSQPLTCLRGSVEVALMVEISEAECREVLEQSLEESHRMAEILGMLRDVLEVEVFKDQIRPVSWRRSIEETFKEVVPDGGNCSLQFVSAANDEVWVNASPQLLDMVTRRLLKRAIKVAQENTPVRFELSSCNETACLSICEGNLFPEAETMGKESQPQSLQETVSAADFEVWLVRRAIKRQRGWLKVNSRSDASRCCRLYLPLAFPGMVRRS